MTDGTMIGNLFQVFEYFKASGLGALGDIEQSLNQGSNGQILISWMKKHVLGRIKYRTLGLAFAAPDTIGNIQSQVGQ